MTNNEIDKIIKSKFTETGYVPNSVADTILKTIQNNKKSNAKYFKIKKIFSGAVASLLLVPCLVFASSHIYTSFGLKNNGYGDESLSSAISQNYIQKNETNDTIYTDNINYKFTDVLINDITMLISLDFNFKENIDDFNGISFINLKIYDENYNQIYIDSEDYKIWSNNMATSIDFITVEKNSNYIKETLLLTSPKFGNINNIKISFDSLVLYIVENGVPKTKEIKNTELLEISLNDKFNHRNNIEYNISEDSISNKNISLTNIILTNTGLGIRFNTKDNSSGYKYNFKITDVNGKELYSYANVISNINDTSEYFVWLDVDDSISKIDNLKLKIIDLNNKENTYNIEK